MQRPTLKPLADQVIVITGASSGIGLVTARAAARRGARVLLMARNETALREIVAGIVADGGSADHAVADVGDEREVRAAADKAVAVFGRIDTWVNCAGVTIYAPLMDTPNDEHERMFRTNYFGVVHGARVAVPHLREAGGALITVGSIVGDIAAPVMGAYAASKHAVKGYVDSLRLELNAADVPIAVTLIKPSGIDTPINAHAANHLDGEGMIPPPAYAPELVADAILHATEHVTRDETVGGFGRAEVLAATHFPGLYARFGGLFAPLLVDRDMPKTPGDNLDAPGKDGKERSRTSHGRRVSLYANRGAVMGAVAAVAVTAAVIGGWRSVTGRGRQ